MVLAWVMNRDNKREPLQPGKCEIKPQVAVLIMNDIGGKPDDPPQDRLY
jgi:hypothetical protein